MKYTAEQVAEQTRNRVSINSGIAILRDVNLYEGDSLFINNDIIVVSNDRDSGVVGTDIIRVVDILYVSIKNEDAVIVVTSQTRFELVTKQSSQELLLALISVLSPA